MSAKPPTKMRLSAALYEAGLGDMAVRAGQGYYDDFLSPLATPCLQLAADLAAAAGTPAALALRARHLDGEFDATTEESEAWASSPDGQDAFGRLLGGKR